jgi:hypothetical protein
LGCGRWFQCYDEEKRAVSSIPLRTVPSYGNQGLWEIVHMVVVVVIVVVIVVVAVVVVVVYR